MSIFQRIFRRPDYNSEISQFIQGLKSARPDLEAQQRAGRAIWWDKHLDREALSDWREARVPKSPSEYKDVTK
jgi:hypothetical protein